MGMTHMPPQGAAIFLGAPLPVALRAPSSSAPKKIANNKIKDIKPKVNNHCT